MKAALIATTSAILLGGCASSVIPSGSAAPARPLPRGAPVALAALMGADAATLMRQFGDPLLDVREGSARKLQFGNPQCVLDAYLYPSGRGEPVVTHIDARRRDGVPVEAAACVAALQGR